jgi:lysophospholipase L1-like esterase
MLFLLEGILRITYPSYSNYNTEMWRYAAELKQRSSYSDIGHEHIPNENKLLYGVEVRTNSMGVRSDKEYDFHKPRDVKRILVLGDSITMGWGVRYEQIYPYLLENLLNNNSEVEFEVINAGVGNYNSLNELATLKKLMDIDPDLIVLGFYINDIEQPKYPSKMGHLLKSKSYSYAFFMDKIININYGTRTNYEEYYSSLYENIALKKSLKTTLLEMIETAENESITLVFLNIPEFHNFEDYAFENVNTFIEKDIIAQSSVIYINLLPVFQEQKLPPSELWVSLEDPHPNSIAHAIIANTAYKEISKINY